MVLACGLKARDPWLDLVMHNIFLYLNSILLFIFAPFYTPVEDRSYYVLAFVRPSVCPSVNFSFPFHNSDTIQDIFIKRSTKVKHHQTMCRVQEPKLYLHFYEIMPLWSFSMKIVSAS